MAKREDAQEAGQRDRVFGRIVLKDGLAETLDLCISQVATANAKSSLAARRHGKPAPEEHRAFRASSRDGIVGMEHAPVEVRRQVEQDGEGEDQDICRPR